MPVSCNFNWVLSMGGETSFCVRNFFWCLSMIRLHSCIFLCINFWNLSAGSLVNVLKLLSLRKLCTFSEYSSEFIITIVLHVICFLFGNSPASQC